MPDAGNDGGSFGPSTIRDIAGNRARNARQKEVALARGAGPHHNESESTLLYLFLINPAD